MKAFAILALSFLAFSAQAATINIKPGETVQIQPNRMTTVSCSSVPSGTTEINIPGGGAAASNCESKVGNLRKKFEFCQKGLSIASCVDKLIPEFRTNNAGCMEEASMVCIEYCQRGMSVASCMDKCK